ncbi:hypothetical protein [Nocardioides rubriscoriae]|uniref:hypothetical protein n=1 Tax=Nocardioides rubriscoriae TaxID=642762 RepID=UPI001B860367|nr:hypothetical protein [Nocardioides rubriscoriae]
MKPIRAELVMDLEETLEAQGYLPMYDFVWTLRGYGKGLDLAQMNALSFDVYEELMDRYSLRLMWATWPIDTGAAWPADPKTPLDFDLDPDGPLSEPLLVLVLQRSSCRAG